MKHRTRSYRRDIELVTKGKPHFLADFYCRPIMRGVNLIDLSRMGLNINYSVQDVFNIALSPALSYCKRPANPRGEN